MEATKFSIQSFASFWDLWNGVTNGTAEKINLDLKKFKPIFSFIHICWHFYVISTF